ncbi:MAG: oxygen-independent coproporphyrinogen III oxidase [Gammaproteobacteria bacterium]|nr:MAG: oxygen-independent coproporphyrinogen III oxidase [Gammaproteobacteria bacterium]
MGLSGKTSCSAHAAPGVIEKPYGLYPTLASFSADYDAGDYREWVEQSNGDPLPAPLALYIQEFSGGDESRLRIADDPAGLHLPVISRELELQGALFDEDRPLQQLVVSESIVTQWSNDQLHQLLDRVQSSFPVHHSGIKNGCARVGIAIPAPDRLRLLHTLGFNNIRFELADDADMQSVLDELGQSVRLARQSGFRQIVLDLRCSETLVETGPQLMQAWLAEVRPDRIRYTDKIDDPAHSYVRILSELGYQNLGMGWYTQAGDSFVQAQAAGHLHWYPLGFTDMPSPDVIGVGPGAISSIGEFYSRNESDWQTYQSFLSSDQLPIVCGMELEADDVLRREIMNMILAASCIRIAAIEDKWGIRFRQFFASETEQLCVFEQRSWLEWTQDKVRIHVRGYHELTEICRVFDRRAREHLTSSALSHT